MKIHNIAILLFFSLSFSTLCLGENNFILEAIGGADSVTIKRQGAPFLLKKGDELQIGDELLTDSHTVVDIRYPDHTLVRIGSNSNFVIHKKMDEHKGLLSQWFSNLLKGTVRVLVPETKEKGGVRFQINTPASTMGVRGTEFVAAHHKNKTVVHTLRGEVLLGPDKTSFEKSEKFEIVGQGTFSEISAGGVPSKPANFSTEDLLKEIDSAKASNPFSELHARKSGGAAVVASAPRTKHSTQTEQKPASPKASMRAKVKNPATKTAPTSENIDDLFIQSVIHGDREMMEALAKKGAEVDFALEMGDGPFHLAVLKKQYKVLVPQLLKLGADINKKNLKGHTALMVLAAENDDVAAVQFVVEQGADPSLKAKDGATALSLAEDRDHKEVVEYLKSLEKN